MHPRARREAADGADWVHEIKHDGYPLKLRRAGDAVRLFTRRGALQRSPPNFVIFRRCLASI
jgi:ATP-dependent DNA ligase